MAIKIANRNFQDAEVKSVLRAVARDFEALRTAFNTLTAKLNADAGVTDTNYATLASSTFETQEK